jgi:hypothetical protein
MADEPIALKLKPCLWRVIVQDDLLNPKRVRNITVKGSSTLKGALDAAMNTDAYDDFKKEFPLCAVGNAQFMGLIDNA